jgi:hypothetical protein
MGNDKLRGELWDYFDKYINRYMPKRKQNYSCDNGHELKLTKRPLGRERKTQFKCKACKNKGKVKYGVYYCKQCEYWRH